jgi:hypothetical protein
MAKAYWCGIHRRINGPQRLAEQGRLATSAIRDGGEAMV